MLDIRLPFIRSSYYPPSLVEKYVSSSYRSFKSGGLVGYAVATDPSENSIFTLNTNINVKAGDLIVTFQWLTGNDLGGSPFTPSDNLNSSYNILGYIPQYLAGNYACYSSGYFSGLGAAYYAVAPASGKLRVKFSWNYPTDSVPGYAVYVFRGANFNGNIYFPNNEGVLATSGSASITTSGLPQTTYHYALLVALVSIQPCFNAVPSITAQGLKQALTWGEKCFLACGNPSPNTSVAFLYAYQYSAQDFTFNLQFTFQGTTVYGYAIALV